MMTETDLAKSYDLAQALPQYRIERLDGTVDGLGDEVLFASEEEAWEAAEVFRRDPASDEGGVRAWLRVVEVES